MLAVLMMMIVVMKRRTRMKRPQSLAMDILREGKSTENGPKSDGISWKLLGHCTRESRKRAGKDKGMLSISVSWFVHAHLCILKNSERITLLYFLFHTDVIT